MLVLGLFAPLCRVKFGDISAATQAALRAANHTGQKLHKEPKQTYRPIEQQSEQNYQTVHQVRGTVAHCHDLFRAVGTPRRAVPLRHDFPLPRAPSALLRWPCRRILNLPRQRVRDHLLTAG